MIERTFNTTLVRSILADPALLVRAGADTELIFDPENQTNIIYLIATDDDNVIGLSAFHWQNEGCYQGHVSYLPKYWGTGLERHTKDAISWMFSNTDCKKIFTFVPDLYMEAKIHGLMSGMKVEGRLKDSYYFDGKVYSQTLLGISKN